MSDTSAPRYPSLSENPAVACKQKLTEGRRKPIYSIIIIIIGLSVINCNLCKSTEKANSCDVLIHAYKNSGCL